MMAMRFKVTEQDLVEIIRRQSEQIDQLIPQNKALQAENARLKKRIEELERRLSSPTSSTLPSPKLQSFNHSSLPAPGASLRPIPNTRQGAHLACLCVPGGCLEGAECVGW